MLRHSFATHTLASLEDLKRAGRLRGSPIILLSELLGHESTATTMRYLHFIDKIDDAFSTGYQAEIDALAIALSKRHASKAG
jgi:site-specific recombinase XerC